MTDHWTIRKRWGIFTLIVLFSVASKDSLAAQAKSPSAKNPATSIDAHFDAAETYQLAGDLTKAAAEYRQGISVALQRLGNLKIANGETAAGLQMLRNSASADPKNIDATVDLGIAYFREGDYEKAKECASRVLKVDPADFRGRNLLGKIHFMQGDFQAAADELQAALAVNADFDVAYSLALANLKLKKLPQATVLFDEIRSTLSKTPRLHVLLGQAYSQTGYFDLAAQEFKNALALDQHHPHAHAFLGITYVELGGEKNYDLATEEFRLELANTPRDYTSQYFLGLIQLERHKLPAAETSLQEAHRARPDDPAPLLLLGRLYNEQKKWPAAIAALRQSITLASSAGTPQSQIALAHELLANAYTSSGQIKEGGDEQAAAQRIRAATADGAKPKQTSQVATTAIAPGGEAQELRTMLLETGRKPAPPSASETRYITAVSKLLGNAYHNLGVMDARKGDYAAAAEEFKQAAQWDNSIQQLDQNWAVAAFRAQSYADAITPLERLLRRLPGDQNIRQMLALSYYMTNNFPASAATFRPIVNALPPNPGLLLSAGIAFVKTGDMATGQQLFSRAFASGSGTPEVHLMLGQAYADQSENAQAMSEFARALELNPKLPEAHYFSGMVLFKRGEVDQAAQQFQSELELNPQHAPSMYQLAYIFLQQHRTVEATQLLAKVIKQQPENSDAHYQLGKALLEQGDVSGATQELEKSVQLRPTDYAYFQLNRAYARAGRDEDAKEAERNFEKLKTKPPAQPVSNP
jgi:tetratricopeptide (TPR) repeat protein